MALDCFVDIALRPDPECAAHVLLGALYAKVHHTLAPTNVLSIAVCFPGYQARPPRLGTRMRLLGTRAALQTLTTSDWLGGLRDHVVVGAVADVPAHVVHRALRRVQAKSSPERLRRRLMKRHGLDETQAHGRIPDSAAETLHHPFVQMHSASTGQTFRLFLHAGPGQPAPVVGTFNAYGLSQDATVPWF